MRWPHQGRPRPGRRSEPSWGRRTRFLENCRDALLAREATVPHRFEAAFNAVAFGVAQSVDAGSAGLDFARILHKFLLILDGPGFDLLQELLAGPCQDAH